MSTPRDPALDAFAAEIGRPAAPFDLARAALAMGLFEYPDLDIGACLGQIDQLAELSEPVAWSAESPPLALARHLFQRLGFAGNQQAYHDPRNSFLNQVLERRLGIPITLSVLYLEVARRLGIDAQGVGLPGHFIVRASVVGDAGESDGLYLDPFHGGLPLSEDDCRERVRAISDGKLPFDSAYLQPVDGRYILLRMLNNLKNAYASQRDLARALRVVERLLVLKPGDADELRNLGLLHAGLGHLRQAVTALERYLALRPDAPDAETIRGYIVTMSGNVARWN
jgi:regulator of sirC expression with transglutaminase-like and TPR domain